MESPLPASSLRRLALAAVLVLAVAVACAVALAAGGGDEKSATDVEALLDRAFRKSIASADVKIDARVAVEGLQGFERPVRIQASGPYVAAAKALPKLDMDLAIGAQGAGQTVQAGLLSTGDRAFVKFGGVFYEQARADVKRANRELRRGGGSGSLRDLGLDPRRWVVDARDEGLERIGGVDARHISGRLDTRSLFRDLNGLVERSANAVGGAAPGVPAPLSGADIDRLAEIVASPTFDVYVGEADEVIRRVSAGVEVSVPERDRPRVQGIKGGSLRFSVELADVNGDQKVSAPAESRPIGDLTKQLGGLGALGAGPGAGGGGSGSSRPGGSAAGGDSQPELDALRRYTDCLDRAGPGETKALSRCRELLRP